MNKLPDNIMTRNEFLKSLGRGGVLTVIALISGLLTVRGSIRSGRSSCADVGACRGCRKLPGCRDPRAVSLRQEMLSHE